MAEVKTKGKVKYDYDSATKRFIPVEAEDTIVSQYEFSVIRKKLGLAGLEELEITAYTKGGTLELGVVQGRYTSLLDTLIELKNYGVILSTLVFKELNKSIDNSYLQLPVEGQSFHDVLNMIYAAIQENEITEEKSAGKQVYNIPVADFQAWFSGGAFYHIDATEVKRELYRKGFLMANRGRFDHNVKCGGEQKKCISIFKKQLDEAVRATTSTKVTAV